MKCMNKEKERRFRTYTKGLKLEMGQNLGGKKDFSEKKMCLD